MSKTKRKNGGYTLLFAVFTAVLVLGVAIFITDVARKQYLISSMVRDSVYALYAADSGVQCALQSDIVNTPPVEGNGFMVPCNNQAWVATFTLVQPADVPAGFDSGKDVFYLAMPDIIFTDNSCAKIEMWTGHNDYNGDPRLVVLSKGYNTCDLLSPRAVERAIQVVE